MRRDALAAVSHLNGMQPCVLSGRPELLFRLHQQHVADLLVAGADAAAWAHAAVALVPLAGADPALASLLETTALLFAFPAIGAPEGTALEAVPPACVDLLGDDHRAETARLVNSALLAAEGGVVTARLPTLLSMLAGSTSLLGGRLSVEGSGGSSGVVERDGNSPKADGRCLATGGLLP